MSVPREVLRVRTTPTFEEWRMAIVSASNELDVSLPENSISVLYAQWALETGRGKACFCWNLGNKRHTSEPLYCILAAAWECSRAGAVPAGAKVIPAPPGAVCAPGDVYYLPVYGAQKFAAYESLEEGARAYLSFLLRPSYQLAWAEVLRGDPSAFARALKALRYYTSDENAYAQALRSLVVEYYREALQRPTVREIPIAVTPDAPTAPVRESGVQLGDNGPANPLGWETRSEWDYEQGFLRDVASTLVCSACEDPNEEPEVT